MDQAYVPCKTLILALFCTLKHNRCKPHSFLNDQVSCPLDTAQTLFLWPKVLKNE